MKHVSILRRGLLLLALLATGGLTARAQTGGVGIGTTAPNASAAFEVQSTAGGLLLPRMTSVQREFIANPAYSLLVFQTDNTPGIYFNGTIWVNLVSGTAAPVDPTTGAVSTLAGNGTAGFSDGRTLAQFNRPTGVACDGNGNVYVADRNNQRVRRIVVATGVVSTMAGSATGTAGYANGTGAAAQFNLPYGVAYDGSSSTVYVADYGNNRIRAVK